jgi:hypothetical protein
MFVDAFASIVNMIQNAVNQFGHLSESQFTMRLVTTVFQAKVGPKPSPGNEEHTFYPW